MIEVKGRKLVISDEESFIGFEGDNIIETRVFKITDAKLFAFSFKLDIKKGIHKNIIELEKKQYNGFITLTWVIREEELIGAGTSQIQLRAFDLSKPLIPKWHSEKKSIEVGSSINAEDYFPPVLPSEFTQMEQRITQAKNETLTAANEVAENTGIVNANTQLVLQSKNIVENLAQEVATNTQQVSDDKNEIIGYKNEVANNTQIVLAKADIVNSQAQSVAENTGIVIGLAEQVSQDAEEVSDNTQTVSENMQTTIEKAAEALQSAANALISEQNAKASEDNAKDSEINALEAMQTAAQAMQDLLAMLGTDIATLTGGKLTPSQIPSIAVTDTFVVADETEMLALDCQTGDIAIRTDENKTYILQGTDPLDITHWQQLKTPTNYADEAGHALTADEAVNATKINGHRVVYMTQVQYDNAVKDPDTVYMVGD